MAFKILLLLLPALVVGKIDIKLSGTFEEDLHLGFSGQDIHVITDEEMEFFQLSEMNLKRGTESELGRWPNDVYVRSPTPWGDLYKSYGWDQVTRALRPKSGRVLSMTSEPQIVMHQIFENNSSKPAKFNVGISQSLENTVSSSWSTSKQLSFGQEINYEFNIAMGKVGGKTSLGLSSSWGSNTENSQTVTVGASSHMDITLQPGQSAIAELEATRGALKLEMEYEATLSGDVALNFKKPYDGHHFWALDINTVMTKAGLSNSLMSKEIIEVGFFSNSRVFVHDTKSHKKLIDVTF